MRAGRAYRLIVRRGGLAPAWLASPDRTDRIEVVGIAEGEVVGCWDLPPREARRAIRAIREDLAQLDAEEFREAWRPPAPG